MALTVNDFGKAVVAAGLMSADDLRALVASTPADARPRQAAALAKLLVERDLLTRYQADELLAGRGTLLVLGDYIIEDKIGAGGMGQVLKAVHRKMGRTVALKLMSASAMKDEAAIKRFHREVKAAARLEHENIVTAHAAGEAHGMHYLVMQYVEGIDLSGRVKKEGPISVDLAMDCICQAARGLAYAHSEGVIHRDIKPANLLLDKKGVVKILDMGLARIDDGDSHDGLTGTEQVLGTVDYMSPEQSESTRNCDARADIYSLGCTLWYLLTGAKVYPGETAIQRIMAHRDAPLPSLLKARDDVPWALEKLLHRMIAKRPDDRCQTMDEVARELDHLRGNTSSSGSTPLEDDTNLGQFFKTINTSQAIRPGIQTRTLAASSSVADDTSSGDSDSRRAKLFTAGHAKQPPWKNPKVLAMGAAVLGVAILAGIIVSLRTNAGTLIVEVDQPNALVQVLDAAGKIEVSQKGETGKVTLSIDPGKHRLKVEKDGFTAYGQEFVMESGGKTELKAKLVRTKKGTVAAASKSDSPQFETPREMAEWFIRRGGKVLIGEKDQIVNVANLPPGDFRIEGVELVDQPAVGDAEAEVIGRLGRVRSVTFFRTSITDKGLRYLGKLQIDHGLSLTYAPITGVGFDALNGSTLHHLTLRGCQFTPEGWQTLAHTTATIHNWYLDETTLNDTALAEIAKAHPETVGLVANRTALTDRGIQPLVAWKSLLYLRLDDTQITDQALVHIEQMKAITKMNLRRTKVTSAGVAKLQKALPNCKIDWDDPSKAAPAKKLAYLDPAFQKWVEETQKLPVDKQLEALSLKLIELNPGFDGKVTDYQGKVAPKITGGAVSELRILSDKVTDISPVRALTALKALNCTGSGPGKGKLSDLSPLQGTQLTNLACNFNPISELLPLKGLPLTSLAFSHSQVSNLWDLRGMPLTTLNFGYTQVADVLPLAGMPLTTLTCSGTQVSDLAVLGNCQSLNFLDIKFTKIAPAQVAALQKALPNCKIEWDDSAKATPAKKLAYLDPAFQKWVADTQKLPAEQQTEAVSKKLVELNPGFDGQIRGAGKSSTPKVENGVVTEFGFFTDQVADISPVRALLGLKKLRCHPKTRHQGKLIDLSPLQGMSFAEFDCGSNGALTDLTALKGMPLTSLTCDETAISDLSVLQGMPLTTLMCARTKVSDLSPLRGMNLKSLVAYQTQVKDLAVLAGMPLDMLQCSNTDVSDLSPLRECPLLQSVNVIGTKVTAAEVAALQKALPNCKIDWDDPSNEGARPKSWTYLLIAEWVFQRRGVVWVDNKPISRREDLPTTNLVIQRVAFGPECGISDADIAILVEWPQSLGFSFTRTELTDAGLRLLVRHGCGNNLGLIANPMTGEGFDAFKDASIATFVLQQCNFTPAGWQAVAGVGRVAMLSLYTSNIKDDEFIEFVRRHPHLRSVGLESTHLTVRGIEALTEHQELTTLNLDRMPDLDDTALEPIKSFKALTTLTLRSTRVTPATVAALQKAQPNLKIEWDDPAKAIRNDKK